MMPAFKKLKNAARMQLAGLLFTLSRLRNPRRLAYDLLSSRPRLRRLCKLLLGAFAWGASLGSRLLQWWRGSNALFLLRQGLVRTLRWFIALGFVRHLVKCALRHRPSLWVKASMLQRHIMADSRMRRRHHRQALAKDMTERSHEIFQTLRERVAMARTGQRS